MIEIPLTSEAEQIFSVIINGQNYNCKVILNSRTAIWSITLSISNVKILDSIALLGGIDIFNQYNIGIKNAFVVNLNTTTLDPTNEDLGTSSKLFILTNEEVSGG